MSGKNANMLTLGVGVSRSNTQYATGNKWYDTNLIRWHNGMLEPIGGWVDYKQDGGGAAIPVGVKPIRDIFSWRDSTKNPYVVFGSTDNVTVSKAGATLPDDIYTDITPVGLVWNTAPNSGYGSGAYGSGLYGFSPAPDVDPDAEGQWAFDNWGRALMGVHSQDGRLFEWNPAVGGLMTVVANAPIDNTLCIATEEEFLMVMGGKNNPTRVQWCSRRDNTDWTPSEITSAGGFELQTDGSIVAAALVQGGILVLTNTDIHMVEYVGPPNYYGRRMISKDTGCLSKNSIASIPGGALWVGVDGFWRFDGNISKVPCAIQHDIFDGGRFDLPSRLFLDNNEKFSELWFFYPDDGGNEADRYAVMSYGDAPHWYKGILERTAWHGPVHRSEPITALDRTPYLQETGWTAAGVSRNGQVYAETGSLELADGDQNIRMDRIFQDFGPRPANEPITPDAYTVSFKLRQAPSAPERIKGPITLNATKGYTTTRLRARQVAFRVDQVVDAYWTLGKVRLRSKSGGGR